MAGQWELTDAEVDEVFARYDITGPAIQRKITAGFAAKAFAAAKANARLTALCRRLIDQAWGGWPEDARASLRRSNPEHPVVRAEAELREIEGGRG